LLAALVVIYGHSYPLSGTVGPALFGSSVQSLAVKVFFVISGYLVIGSWRRDPCPIRYLARRCLRIFPGLVVVVLLSALILGPIVSSYSFAAYFKSPLLIGYLKNIALFPIYALPGVFTTITYPNAVNGSLWSLPVEFSLYILTPLFVLRGRGQSLRICLSVIALCAISLYLLHVRPIASNPVLYGTPLTAALDTAPYFFLGAAWQIMADKRIFNTQIALLAVLMLSLVPSSALLYEIALYFVLPYAILSFCLARPALFGWVGRYGDFSYGVYIYGFVVQQTVSFYFHTQARPHLNFLIALIPTVLLAAASWHYVEKRFLLLKPKREILNALGLDVSSGGA
jgi:peptidoglycan/LPS O-acetylase OafA/YrhL